MKRPPILAIEVTSPEDLRAHLDWLNDEGLDCNTAGMDDDGRAFLVQLAGIYAEGEVVTWMWPWDPECAPHRAERCDECGAQRFDASTLDLAYPVTILTDRQCTDGGGSA